MELRHLRYFVAVADELSFTRAATALRLAQPSLTRQIHNLEEELGVRLFDRGRNQVSLTEEGRAFLADARRLLSLSLESVKSVQQLSRGESGQLNLGYLFRFNFDLLPEALMQFGHVCPSVAVNLFDMPPAAQIRALENRKIDLGFVGLRPMSRPEKGDPLMWTCITHHEVMAVLPADHPLGKKRVINIGELSNLYFVTMSEEKHPGSREWLTAICERAGFKPRVLQDVETEAGLLTFVAEGLGVTLARKQMKNLPHHGVIFREVSTPAKADYWIASHRENVSKALHEFTEIVKQSIAPN
jgi:DNA-binding transcriptional LysR family regulator